MPKFPDWFLILILPLKIMYFAFEAAVIVLIPYSLRRKKSVTCEVAVVTGGGSGIGRLVALQLAKHGAKVVILDINQSYAENVQMEIQRQGGDAFAYKCDVSARKQVYKMAERVLSEVGKVAVLVNNAGIVNGKPLLEIPDEKIEQLFAVNTLAHFWTVKAFLPGMQEQNHGHIVTISSAAAFAGINKLTDYCASKAAVAVFHEALDVEIRKSGKTGVHLTLVCPYLANTGMFNGAKSRFPTLLPMLEPQYLAEKIVQSILLNERRVVLPGIMRMLIPVSRILPSKVLEGSDDLFGAHGCMDNFVGTTINEEGTKLNLA